MTPGYRAALTLAGLTLFLAMLGWRMLALETPPPSVSPHPVATSKPHHRTSPTVAVPPSHSTTGTDGREALFDAGRRGDIPAVMALLDKGVDVNVTNDAGLTLLLALAKEGNHSDVIQSLLEVGANPEAKDEKGWTALTWAADRDDANTITVLLQKSNRLRKRAGEALCVAAEKNHLEALKALLDNEVDINQTDKEGRTALFCATKGGDPDTMKFLLDQGADVNHKGSDGMTPLMLAAAGNRKDTVQSLLDKEANTGERNNKGETALLQSVRANAPEVCRTLIAAGADVNAPDFDGNTPLMVAASAGQNELVQMLLDKNADVHARDSQGETALALARKNNHSDTADLLTKAGGD